MTERFGDMLVEGKRNSLGRVDEVIATVMADPARLEELYLVQFHDDQWARMRAADAVEKIARDHPEWVVPYIDRFQSELAGSTQPSIQWHLAQIYMQVPLTDVQRVKAIEWLMALVETVEVDWIVSANAMEALVHYERTGHVDRETINPVITTQLGHHSKSVVRKATTLLDR